MYASMMIFFISNAIETQMITTGAFEIYLNGKSSSARSLSGYKLPSFVSRF